MIRRHGRKLTNEAVTLKVTAYDEWVQEQSEDIQTILKAWALNFNLALPNFGKMASSELLSELILVVADELRADNVKNNS